MDYVKYFALLLLYTASCVDSNSSTKTCGQKELTISYLDLAADMISKAKDTFPTCEHCRNNETQRFVDCADIFLFGHNESGVYKIWPVNRVTGEKSLDVYCDMETNGGGWTTIQRRGDFQRPKDYFFKDWNSYKEGFGDIEKDFWLGNDNIYALTNQKLYSARFDLQDVENNKRYAQYDMFWIDDENHNYTLHIYDYSGDAGDSMKQHDNMKFSTKDQDNDTYKPENCAQKFKGAWWYFHCHLSNLNGEYLKGKHKSNADGVIWSSWKGKEESLESTEIKIRPKNFMRQYTSSSTTPEKKRK